MATRFQPKATPVTRSGAGWTRLEAVEIASNHPTYGNGKVRLDPVQTEHIHARLSQIDFAFSHHIQTGQLVTSLSPCGAEALPVSRIEGDTVTLDALVIQKDQARVYLTPAEITAVRKDLERIVIDYLHDNGWGGEDARRQ
jgi:hypothetical protein